MGKSAKTYTEFVAMPENPINLNASEENNILGPDNFGFYTNEIKGLLSQDDVLLPYAHQNSISAGNLHGVGRKKCSTKNSCQTKENNAIIGPAPFFSNGIDTRLSESKRKRLKSLLRQSVVTFKKDVDKMINPVLSVCRIQSCLRCKERLLKLDVATGKANTLKQPGEKPNAFSDCSSLSKAQTAKNVSSDNKGVDEDVKVDDDLRCILESDSTKVEELLKGHINEISATLDHMEQNFEELLNTMMTICRVMTIAEKQQLRKLIQKLPPRSLDRVAEIIEHNKPSDQNSSELRIDLDKVDNVTLWRLYFYLATVIALSNK